MALVATFAGDFDKFEKALRQGVVSLQTFDRATKTATRSLQRELESISGQKVAAEAARMAEALKRLGGEGGVAAGALKLTDAELKRISVTLNEAAAKAAKLGEQLPASLAQARDAVNKLVPPVGAATGGLGSLGAIVSKLGPLIPVTTIAGGATALLAMGKAAFESAGRVADLAQKTGLSTATIQRFEAVAKQTGTSVEAFSSAAFKLGVNVENGAKGTRQAIEALGISFEELKGLKPEQQFDRVVGALERVESTTDRNAKGVAIFGKQFAEIAPAVAEGYSKIADAAVVASDRQIQALDRAGDALARFQSRLMSELQAALGNVALLLEGSGTGLGSSLENLTAQQAQLIAATKKNGGDLAAVYKQIAEAQAAARKEFEQTNPMQGPPVEAITKTRDYVKELSDLRAKLGELKPAEREQLDAALKLTGVTEDLANQFGLSEDALKLYQGTTKESTKSTNDFAESLKKLTGAGALADAEKAIKQIAAVGGPGKIVSGELKGLADVFSRAAAAALELGRVDLATQYRDLARTLQPVVQFQQRYNVTIGEYVTSAQLAENATEGLADQVARLTGEVTTFLPPLQAATRDLFKFLEPLKAPVTDGLGKGPSIASQLFAGLDEVLLKVPDTIAQAFVFGGSIADAVKSLASQIGATLGRNIGEAFKSLGRFGGPIGAAIGSLAGLAVDLFKKIGPDPANDVMRRVGREWGTEISRGLAEAIVVDAKTLFGGDRQTAEVFNFGKILEEAGGLNDLNFDRFIARFRDVFVLFGQGRLSLQQTQQVLEENFGAFADVVLKSGQVASKEFLELIKLNQQFGTESAAILDFVRSQAARAGTALVDVFAGANSAEEFERLGVLALGAFNAAIEGGLSFREALESVAPALDRLQELMGELGLQADAALKPLIVAQQVSETTAGTAAAALGEAILALSNFNALNEQTLDALEGQLATVFSRVQAEVAALGGEHADALRQVLPFLEQALRASEEFGLTLDPATRELIDQARELGLLGDAGQEETDLMREGFESVVDAVHELTDAILGIPEAARRAAQSLAEIKLPPIDRRRPDDGGDGTFNPDDNGPIGPASIVAAQVAAAASQAVGQAQALVLQPVFVFGQAPASVIDAAIASGLPVALATGQPRAAVTTIARLAAEEAIARAS